MHLILSLVHQPLLHIMTMIILMIGCHDSIVTLSLLMVLSCVMIGNATVWDILRHPGLC